MTESHDVLIDPARRQREEPTLRGGEEIRYEVADLHDREVVTRGIETEREQIANEVVRLAARGEDRPNPARLHDRDVTTDRISSENSADGASKRRVALGRTECTADGKVNSGAFACGDTPRHPSGVDDARPDRGGAPRREVRMREEPFEHVGDVAGATGGGVVT